MSDPQFQIQPNDWAPKIIKAAGCQKFVVQVVLLFRGVITLPTQCYQLNHCTITGKSLQIGTIV